VLGLRRAACNGCAPTRSCPRADRFHARLADHREAVGSSISRISTPERSTPQALPIVEGWTERVASGDAPTADLDLVAAIDRFREGLEATLQADFPGTAVRTAFRALGGGGAVLARSGARRR